MEKYCINCKHSVYDENDTLVCERPLQGVDLVFGEPLTPDRPCKEERKNGEPGEGRCGPAGSFFVDEVEDATETFLAPRAPGFWGWLKGLFF